MKTAFVNRIWPRISGLRLCSRANNVPKRILAVPGLAAPVEILRDDKGVPHIFAQRSWDIFFALGYAMADDRLWQMESLRRLAGGTLAEVFGPKALVVDRFVRTLGLGRLGEQEEADLTSDSREVLQAFSAGINHFLHTQRWLPFEFLILRFRPRPWRAADSLAIGKLTALLLEPPLQMILLATDAYRWLGSQLRTLLADLPASSLPEVEALDVDWAGLLTEEAIFRAASSPGAALSNNWVISGSRTVTGKPLLANDPHLFVANPPHWYEAHLQSPEIHVAGAFLAGAPVAIIGHNEAIAWGVTNVGGLVTDLYLEQLHPQDSKRYRVGDGWEQMSVIHEQISVRGRPSVAQEVFSTRHGPVLAWEPQGYALVWRWAGAEHTDELRALLGVNRASNWEEFRQALRSFAVPAQNFVYADVGGNIGYQLAGRIPIRCVDALGPVPGWKPEGEWVGYVPFEELPNRYNSPEGWIATANQKVVDDNFQHRLTWAWQPPHRAQRLAEILVQSESFSAEDCATMQQDLVSHLARSIVPRLVTTVRDETAPLIKTAMSLLESWDYRLTPESNAAAIYATFAHHLLDNLLRERLPSRLASLWLGVSYLLPDDVWELAFPEHAKPGNSWVSPQRGEELVRRSLHQALAFLENRFGPDISRWQWGTIHRVASRHIFGLVSALGRPLNFGPYPYGGDETTLCVGEYFQSSPYDAVIVPSFRFIADLADWDRCQACNTTGQSGRPWSRHYGDQVADWLAGCYHPMPFSRAAVEAAAVERLTLIPPAQKAVVR